MLKSREGQKVPQVTFRARSDYGSGHATKVVAGDADGDGIRDLALVTVAGTVALFHGNGDGNFGSERIIAFSRHADRQALAREFGATDIVEERGDEGAEKVKQLTDGLGAHSTIEAR